MTLHMHHSRQNEKKTKTFDHYRGYSWINHCTISESEEPGCLEDKKVVTPTASGLATVLLLQKSVNIGKREEKSGCLHISSDLE